MTLLPEITYRNVPKMNPIDNLILDKVNRLEKACHYLMSCQVSVEQAEAEPSADGGYRVRIDLRIAPDHRLVVTRESPGGDMESELPTVIRQAFDAAFRRVRSISGAPDENGRPRSPLGETSAVVHQLFPDEGWGLLRTVDGRKVYFNQNSLVHERFDNLEVGDGVRCIEEMGHGGPRASVVQIIDGAPASA